jgi:hypothetical protein
MSYDHQHSRNRILQRVRSQPGVKQSEIWVLTPRLTAEQRKLCIDELIADGSIAVKVIRKHKGPPATTYWPVSGNAAPANEVNFAVQAEADLAEAFQLFTHGMAKVQSAKAALRALGQPIQPTADTAA